MATAARARPKVVPIPKQTGTKRASEVRPVKVKWLWEGYLPKGKVVILEGDPGGGKSTAAIDFAARITTGAKWPDESKGVRPSNVLIFNAEDTPEDTTVPRLKAAGADLSRVVLVEEVKQPDGSMDAPSIPRDIFNGSIEKLIRDEKASLVIFDVLMAYLEGDSYRDQAVRKMLTPLARMAERTGATILLIRHLKKSKDKNVLYRGSGSIGIIGAARASYVMVQDPDTGTGYFVCGKMNIAAKPPALIYETKDGKIEWSVPTAAEQLFLSPEDLGLSIEEEPEPTPQEMAREWLVWWLMKEGGESPVSVIRREGKGANGYTEKMLRTAKRAEGIRMRFDDDSGVYYWYMPDYRDRLAAQADD